MWDCKDGQSSNGPRLVALQQLSCMYMHLAGVWNQDVHPGSTAKLRVLCGAVQACLGRTAPVVDHQHSLWFRDNQVYLVRLRVLWVAVCRMCASGDVQGWYVYYEGLMLLSCLGRLAVVQKVFGTRHEACWATSLLRQQVFKILCLLRMPHC